MSTTPLNDHNKDNSIEIIYPELIGNSTDKDTKCAEIYSCKQFNFYIICTYCKKKFYKLKPFAIHVRGYHLNQSSQELKNSKKPTNHELTQNNHSIIEPPIKQQNMPEIIICEDNDCKINSQVDSIHLDKNNKFLFPDLKNKISKPKIKIVLKKGQHFTSKSPQKSSSSNVIDKQFNYIKCGFGNCKQMFASPENLNKHKTELHSADPNRPYKCKDCNKTFIRTSNLFTHVRRFHLRERKFKCDYCDKEFFEKTGKLKHELIHTGEKPCICDKCGERFPVTHKLNMHIKAKHEMPQIECNVCHKLFHNKENLTLHMICHRNEQPYACNICSKRFPRKRSLYKHSTIHATDRDFICRICGKDFTSQIRISCHMKSHGIPYMEINVLRKSRQERFEPYEIEKCTT